MFQVEIRNLDPKSKEVLSREIKWFNTYVEATSYVEGFNSFAQDKEAIFVPFH